MKNRNLKKAAVAVFAAMMVLFSVFVSFAEAVKEVSYESGRSVVV